MGQKAFLQCSIAGCVFVTILVVACLITAFQHEKDIIKIIDVLGNYIVAICTFFSVWIAISSYSKEKHESRIQKYELLHNRYLTFAFELFNKLQQKKNDLHFTYNTIDDYGQVITKEYIGDDAISEINTLIKTIKDVLTDETYSVSTPSEIDASLRGLVDDYENMHENHLESDFLEGFKKSLIRVRKNYILNELGLTNEIKNSLTSETDIREIAVNIIEAKVAEQLSEYNSCLLAIAINIYQAVKCENRFALKNGTTLNTIQPFFSKSDNEYIANMSVKFNELSILIKNKYEKENFIYSATSIDNVVWLSES